MSLFGAFAAPVVRIYCTPRARRFAAALNDVAAAQRATLARIVRASASTAYGRSLGLNAEESIDSFRNKVPVVDYHAIERWVGAQRNGQLAALTPGRIRSYEPTSGSTSTAKHIPYNDALLVAFRSAFAIWAHDLLTHVLRPRSARVFMSVSAPIEGSAGFADDREYLDTPLRALLGRFIVTPPRLRDPELFRDALACALVSANDLEIMSVWNPSYLLVLLEHFETHRERLLPALSPGRRAVLSRDRIAWQTVWPALQLVSCWTAAAAAVPARALTRYLPHAFMQGKGLLATEAPITVPLTPAGGCVPMIDEVFLELEDAEGRARLLAEAERDAEYALIVTQPGGLLRYRLGDRVRMSGRHRDTPLIEFVGRADNECDLVGEKLSEGFVAKTLADTASLEAFCTLLPLLPATGRPRYCLLTDDSNPGLSHALEEALLKAFRYREARVLTQLEPIEVMAHRDMRRIVHDALVASGSKAGDIKDRALITSPDRAAHIHAYVAQRLER